MSQAVLEQVRESTELLTPGQKLELIEHLAKSLRSPQTERTPEQRREAMIRLLDKLAAMPATSPSDGLSNRDHDRILYGERT